MPFDYIGAGAPGLNKVASPGAGSAADYFDVANGVMYTLVPGVGWTPVLESTQDALTAAAGGGQKTSGASLITAQNARFTTVATIGDSGTLPKLVPGLIVSVANAGANSMNVFAGSGDKMNGTLNGSFAVGAAKNALFVAYASTWHSFLSA